MPLTSEPIAPAIYTVAQASAYLSLGRTTVYELAKTGALQSVKLGARFGITKKSLDALIEANLQQPVKAAPKKPATAKRGRGRPPKFPQRQADGQQMSK